jgi:tetratricopeptide (TPR) repeat protein
VLWFLDRKGESEREFLAITKVFPADLVPHLYLGLAAYERRDFPRAKMEFARAGTLASSNPEVLPAVFESYLAIHDMSFPAKVVGQVTRAEEPDSALILRLGALLLQYGEYDNAVVALEKLVAMHKDSAEVWRMLAEAYDRQDKPEQAYRAYSRAAENDPNLEDNYLAFAEFASAHGNNDYALQVVARGLQRLPKSPALLFEQGILLALKGDREQADNSFMEANRLKPAWNFPLLALGISQLESGDAAQAAVLFQEARTANPRDSRAYYLYAAALSREAGVISVETRAKAIAALDTVIEMDPKDARAHALLGQLDLAAGKLDAAALEWQTALKIEPENATALYQLGLLRRRQGKTAEAERLLQAFQRVKAKKPDEEKSLVEILRVVPEKRP